MYIICYLWSNFGAALIIPGQHKNNDKNFLQLQNIGCLMGKIAHQIWGPYFTY